MAGTILRPSVLGDGLRDVGLFGRASAVLDRARVDVASACEESCASVGLMASARLTPRPGFDAMYGVSDLSDRLAAVVFADQLTQRAFTAVRLVSDDTDSTGIAQVAAVSARRGPALAALHGVVAARPEARGVGGQISWHWTQIGWGLGVSGAWAPVPGDWTLLAGLSFAQ